jgi:hypothetical protein
MASMPLRFVPPTDPDIAALRIYEAPTAAGPYTQIERVTAIGTPPDYIDRYVTNSAVSVTDWFSIAWENTSGGVSDLSTPLQGGTDTLVGEITSRVMMRDSALDENIVFQEAEVVVAEIAPDALTPADVSVRTMSGMVLLTMARTALFDMLKSSSAEGLDFTAGIVSVKSSSSTTSRRDLKTIEAMIELANRYLGRTYSFFLLLEEIEVAGGYKRLAGIDITRQIVEYE